MTIKKNVGTLIEEYDLRNVDRKIKDFYGINVHKEFMPTLADTSTVDSGKYKVITNNSFVFSGMQTGRDKKIRIGLYKGEPGIVSPAYTTFKIKDTNVIRPEYFLMCFLSDEMDRYGWFISDSSIRANLDWEKFEKIELELPSIDIQDKYIKIYGAMERVHNLKSMKQQLCPILVRKSIDEGGAD